MRGGESERDRREKDREMRDRREDDIPFRATNDKMRLFYCLNRYR